MKVLKVFLFVIIGFIALFALMAIFGMQDVKDARNLQIQEIDLNAAEDGTYTGTYENGRFTNTIETTVLNHQITSINHVLTNNPSQQAVFDEIIQIIMEEQRIDIDTVSGATATTNSFLKAVENAFD